MGTAGELPSWCGSIRPLKGNPPLFVANIVSHPLSKVTLCPKIFPFSCGRQRIPFSFDCIKDFCQNPIVHFPNPFYVD